MARERKPRFKLFLAAEIGSSVPRFRVALILLGAIALASACLSPAQTQAPQNSAVIRSEADLVVVPVTVTDGKGRAVVDLTKDEFRVLDNGKPQSISLFMHGDVPITAGLIIDCSGSMRSNREEVAEAAKDFLESSSSQDQMFVVNFNETPAFGLPPGIPFTNDVAALEAAVQSGPSEGMTALYDAIQLALDHLDLGRGSKKALVVISDGGDNASEQNFRKTLAAIQRSSVVVYTIGLVDNFLPDVNPGVLRKLANATGGEAYFPKSAEQLPGISQQIARDLRQQYTLAYLPLAGGKNGAFRTIHVSLPKHKNLKVRTRSGYLATSNPGANSKSGSGS